MALIDVIKCDIQDGEFCYKFPSDDLRLGSQLVVYPSQTAFFLRVVRFLIPSLQGHIRSLRRTYLCLITQE